MWIARMCAWRGAEIIRHMIFNVKEQGLFAFKRVNADATNFAWRAAAASSLAASAPASPI